MKAFLDTNILLDLLLERDGYEASARILQLRDEGKVNLCVSILTMVNVAYVYKKSVGQNVVIPNLKCLSDIVTVLPMNNEMLQQALYLEGKDFEDILQYTCAIQNQCDAVITRDVKDFRIHHGLKNIAESIPVYSPDSFLNLFTTGTADRFTSFRK
jgi:predicted nucleic acid-binding protein